MSYDTLKVIFNISYSLHSFQFFFQMFSYYITNIKRQIHSQISKSIDLAVQTMKKFQTLSVR